MQSGDMPEEMREALQSLTPEELDRAAAVWRETQFEAVAAKEKEIERWRLYLDSEDFLQINRMTPLDRTGEPHDPYLAIDRSPMDREELYYIIRFAERMDYSTAIRRLSPGYPFKMWREWLIWIGGWETSELGQWDRGKPAWNVWRDRVDWKPNEPRWRAYLRRLTAINDVTPLSLLGHLITFYGWGVSLHLARLRQGWGCLTLCSPYVGALPYKLYWSPDGTSSHDRAQVFWERKVNRPDD